MNEATLAIKSIMDSLPESTIQSYSKSYVSLVSYNIYPSMNLLMQKTYAVSLIVDINESIYYNDDWDLLVKYTGKKETIIATDRCICDKYKVIYEGCKCGGK